MLRNFLKRKKKRRGIIGLSRGDDEEEVSNSFNSLRDLVSKTVWYSIPVTEYTQEELRKWCESISGGKKNDKVFKVFFQSLVELQITSGKKLCSLTYTQIYCFLVNVKHGSSGMTKLSKRKKAFLFSHFAYLKYCTENSKLFNRYFPAVLQKVIDNPLEPCTSFNSLKALFKEDMEINVQLEVSFAKQTHLLINTVLGILDIGNLEKVFYTYFLELLQKKEQLELKLVVIDQFIEADKKTMSQATKFITPFVDKIVRPKFGLWHTGIIMGNTNLFLEWTVSHLLQFQRFSSNVPIALFAFQPFELTEKNVKTLSFQMANLLHNWNTTKKYSLLTCNCQNFVLAVMEIFGVKLEMVGSFKKFVDRLRHKGHYEKIFQPSSSFAKKFLIDREIQQFRTKTGFLLDTHQKLDKFSLVLKEKNDPDMENTPEWNLLKSWDATYWYMFFNEKKDPLRYKCHKVDEKIQCPFLKDFGKVIEDNKLFMKLKDGVLKEKEQWENHNRRLSEFSGKEGFIFENNQLEINHI